MTHCDHLKSRTLDTRTVLINDRYYKRRRRKCLLCGERFSTVEILLEDKDQALYTLQSFARTELTTAIYEMVKDLGEKGLIEPVLQPRPAGRPPLEKKGILA